MRNRTNSDSSPLSGSFWGNIIRKTSLSNYSDRPILREEKSKKNLKSLRVDILEFKVRVQEILDENKSFKKKFDLLSYNAKHSEKTFSQMVEDTKSYDSFQTLSFYLEQILTEKFISFKTDPIWREIQKLNKKAAQKKKEPLKVNLLNLQIPEAQVKEFKKYLEKVDSVAVFDLAMEIQSYNELLGTILTKDKILNEIVLSISVTCNSIPNVFEDFEFVKNPKIIYKKLSIIDEIIEEIVENLELIESSGKDLFLNLQTNTSDFSSTLKTELTIGSISEELENMISKELSYFKEEKNETKRKSMESELNDDEYTYLFRLVKRGKYEEFLKEIESIPNWHKIRDKNKRSFIHYAAFEGIKILQFLIENGFNVDDVDKDLRTPLFFACISEKRDNCLILMGNKCKVNTRDIYGISPLSICMEKHLFEIANDLILFNADINFKKENGSTYLHEAISKGDVESFKWVLEKNPKVNFKDSNENTPLMKAVSENDSYFMSELLSINSVQYDYVDFKGMNMIHTIISKEKLEHLKVFAKIPEKYLLKFDKIFKDKFKGNTVLHLAVEKKNFKLVKLLIVILKRLAFDMNQTNDQEETPLMVANRISSCFIENYLQNSSKENQELKNIIKISQILQQEHSMDDLSSVLTETNQKTSQLFNTLKINTGQTIGELSKKHRVIIFTIKWFGCPLCQELIDIIGKTLFTMLKMNTIPIIGHQQNHETAKSYFANNKDPISKYLPYCRIGKEEREILGLFNSPLSEHMKTMKKNLSAVIYENRYFSAPLDVVAPLTAFGVFVIENNHITKKIIYKDFTKKLNFGLILQEGMTKYQFNENEEEEEENLKEIFEMFKELDFKKLKRELEDHQIVFKKDEDEKNDELLIKEMNDVLYDDTKRYYFKAFAINEFASETLIFYDQVLIYKSVPKEQWKNRKKIFEKIYTNFISDDGISKIVISNKNSSPISKILVDENNDGYSDDVFDDILKEIKNILIFDLFSRYKKSSIYEESKSKNSTVTYFL
jgi:ankyrin repeat protein